jgi:hypothetical protein
MALGLMPAGPSRHLKGMRAGPALALSLVVGIAVPGCTKWADPPGEAEEASHLATCLRAGERGPEARGQFCDLLRFHPDPKVADACRQNWGRTAILWEGWCHLTFRWHPW